MGLVLNEKQKRVLKCIREHPRLCLVQFFALLSVFPLFICTNNFMVAVTPEQAIKRFQQPLPPGWTAGVMNGGHYIKWWTIGKTDSFWSLGVQLRRSSGIFVGFHWLALVE